MSKSKRISREDWRRPIDDAPMTLIVSKRKRGVIQRMYLHGELIQETFSKRPYRLGQASDGTIDACVYGLLILYCRDCHLDLQELVATAYPDRESFPWNEQEAILERALAQGIVIPKQWDSKAFTGLLDSLTEINNHALVALLTEATDDQT
jgi:hypothetical protein